MIKYNLLFNKNKFWIEHKEKNITLWIKGYCNYSNIDLIQNFNLLSKKEIGDFIRKIYGHFSIIYSSSERTIIVIDRIGSTPINYFEQNAEIYISADFDKLKREYKGKLKYDEKAKLQILMAGFTHGKRTLHPDIKTLSAGQYVLFEKNKILTYNYFSFFGDIKNKYSQKRLIEELSGITLSIFKETLRRVGDKQIVIPLSAGNDSV